MHWGVGHGRRAQSARFFEVLVTPRLLPVIGRLRAPSLSPQDGRWQPLGEGAGVGFRVKVCPSKNRGFHIIRYRVRLLVQGQPIRYRVSLIRYRVRPLGTGSRFFGTGSIF